MTRLALGTLALVGWAWALGGASGCGGGSGGSGGSGDAMQGDSDGPCGAAVCLQPRSDDANAPRLTALAVAHGSPFDPWTLILDAEFTDADGDLDPGSADVTIGTGVTSFELGELFRQRGLAADATSGRLAISVRFTETLADDSTFDLGVQLVDGAGLRSNCYALRLHVGVGPP